jgi:hypothetical protein
MISSASNRYCELTLKYSSRGMEMIRNMSEIKNLFFKQNNRGRRAHLNSFIIKHQRQITSATPHGVRDQEPGEGEAAKDGVRVLRLGRRGSADAQREQGGLLQNPVSYVYSKLP